MLTGWADWFFRDRASDQIVIGQWPNAPLWLFGATRVASWLTDGRLGYWSWIASEVFLFVWAADELARGVNPWRRSLGGAVLIWMAVSRLL